MVELIKIKNKAYGYKCDKTGLVDRVMYSDNSKWLCKDAAIKEWGVDSVNAAEEVEL